MEVPICLDCGTPMLRYNAALHALDDALYCPKCEVADDLVVDQDVELSADDQALVDQVLARPLESLRALKRALADDGLELGGH